MRNASALVGDEVQINSTPCVTVRGRQIYPAFEEASAIARLPNGSIVTKSVTYAGDGNDVVLFSAAREGATELIGSSVGVYQRPGKYIVQDKETSYRFPIEFSSVAYEVYSLASPLPCDISHGSHLTPAELTLVLTEEENTVCGQGTVEWTLVKEGGGERYRYTTVFDIVKRQPMWTLDQSELIAYWPWIASHRDRSDLAYENLINTALEMDVLRVLMAKGVKEQDIISTEPLKAAHATACAYRIALNDDSVDKEKVQMLREEFEAMISEAMNSRAWYEAPQSETVDVSTAIEQPMNKFTTALAR